jgi:hypothetical protein
VERAATAVKANQGRSADADDGSFQLDSSVPPPVFQLVLIYFIMVKKRLLLQKIFIKKLLLPRAGSTMLLLYFIYLCSGFSISIIRINVDFLRTGIAASCV